MDYKDYYTTLGLKRDAGSDEIKRAYRRLARETHPDVSDAPDAAERFKAIGEAYEVLKDPEKRAAYDQLGAGWREGEAFRPPPDWDGGFQFSGGGFTEADPAEMSAFFEALFGRGDGFDQGGAGFARRRFDRHLRLEIDLADAYRGGKRALSLDMPTVGQDGRIAYSPRRIEIEIPKGIEEGAHLRVPDADGDLLIEIAFRPHPVFTAVGRDVTMDLPITPWEAALGGAVRIPTPAGEVDLKIPSGARAGQTLRLRGKGLPGRPAGDLMARLRIVAPPAETPEGRALYERMAKEMPFDPRAGLEV